MLAFLNGLVILAKNVSPFFTPLTKSFPHSGVGRDEGSLTDHGHVNSLAPLGHETFEGLTLIPPASALRQSCAEPAMFMVQPRPLVHFQVLVTEEAQSVDSSVS